MKKQLKRIASVVLAATLLISMFAAVSVSAAETGEAVGAATITPTSNFCDVEAVTGNIGDTVSVVFKAPQDIKIVDLQWGLNYDKAKLQISNIASFAGNGMATNPNATAYNVVGSCINIETGYELAKDDTMFNVKFKVLADGAANVDLTLVDLTKRTEASDEIIIVNTKSVDPDEKTGFTVNAKSNFFAAGTAATEDISQFEDENGDVYITVEYKLCASDKYLLGIDVDELTYDPSVLEWKEDYNKYNGVIDFFPFAAENGFGSGSVQQQTAAGRIVGNFSYVGKPAACTDNEDGSPVTAVKAVFKLLDKNAGSTTVNCNVDMLFLCDRALEQPYLQYLPVDGGVVNAEAKALATYETGVSFGEEKNNIGDIDNDGTIDVKDVTLLQRYLAEFTDAESNPVLNMKDAANLKRCDTDLNGRIDVRDVAELQRFLADMKVVFR